MNQSGVNLGEPQGYMQFYNMMNGSQAARAGLNSELANPAGPPVDQARQID